MSSQQQSPCVTGPSRLPILETPVSQLSIYQKYNKRIAQPTGTQIEQLADLLDTDCFLAEVLRVLAHYTKYRDRAYSDADLPVILAVSIALAAHTRQQP